MCLREIYWCSIKALECSFPKNILPMEFCDWLEMCFKMLFQDKMDSNVNLSTKELAILFISSVICGPCKSLERASTCCNSCYSRMIYCAFLHTMFFDKTICSALITSNGRPCGCWITCTDIYSQCYLFINTFNNSRSNKTHWLIVMPYLSVIASDSTKTIKAGFKFIQKLSVNSLNLITNHVFEMIRSIISSVEDH